MLGLKWWTYLESSNVPFKYFSTFAGTTGTLGLGKIPKYTNGLCYYEWFQMMLLVAITLSGNSLHFGIYRVVYCCFIIKSDLPLQSVHTALLWIFAAEVQSRRIICTARSKNGQVLGRTQQHSWGHWLHISRRGEKFLDGRTLHGSYCTTGISPL